VDDLNSKTESIGCKGNDQSGKILEKILTDTSITIHNDTTPTYYQHQGKKRIRMESEQNIPQYTEILDLVLSSSSLNNKITSFEVLTEHDMTSDHCPVTFNFKISGNDKIINSKKNRLNFSKANWVLFRKMLEDVAQNTSVSELKSLEINKLNEKISSHMLETIEESVPKFIKRGFNSLPKEIVDLIKFKKETRKSMKSTKSSSLKSLYNKLTSQVKISIKNYREGVWAKFIEKLGPHPVSSKAFWDKINQARSKKRAVSIPVLLKDSVEYKNDDDKVKIFSAMLGEIFSGKDNEYEFDLNHKKMVNEAVNKHEFSNDYLPFSTHEIIKTIKKLKVNSSPGLDRLQNIFLKNLPYDYVSKVLF